jgi:hypothetical protein
MYKKNKYLFILLFFITLCSLVHPELEKRELTSSKGLKIKFLLDDTLDFIHAELLIQYKGKFKNPAVPNLTMVNIFNQNVNEPGSSLLSNLRRLGNDYKIEQTAEFFIIKINFLPDRISYFLRFLKGIYRYRPLIYMTPNPDSYSYRKRESETQEKFEKSVSNYWRYLKEGEEWKRDLAFQIAYNKLFSGYSLGNTLITPNSVKEVTLKDLRTFYQRTFRFPNSLLIIKGNIRPHIVFGLIEKELASFKQQLPEMRVPDKIKRENVRQVFICDTKTTDLPLIFWFESIPPINDPDYIPLLVINNVLFGFPMGRIYHTARSEGIGMVNVKTEINNHQYVSVICNTIGIRYRDIERFIMLSDLEKRKLNIKKVDRREYLNTLSFFIGRRRVNTQDIDNDVNHEILISYFPVFKQGISNFNSISPQYTLNKINEQITPQKRGIIVILGNASLIRQNLGTIEAKEVKLLE